MKKIWQKSLASMVSAALCLTAFVGCLTVNAATNYEGAITSDGVKVEATAKEATIELVVSATVPEGAKGMAYTGLKVTSDYGTLTNAVVTTGNAYVETKTNPVTGESTDIPDIGEDGQFIVAANALETGVKSFTVSLTFNKAENVTAGTTYPVNVEYLGSKKDIGAADWDENTFTFTTTGVVGIHVHNVVYTSNENGTHTSSCNAAGCPGFTPATEPCVDENSDNVCDKCSENMAPAEDNNISLTNSYVQVSANLNLVLMLDKRTVSQYARHEIEFSRQSFDNKYAFKNVSETRKVPTTSYGNNEYYTYNGIGMYELNMPVTAAVKCYDSNDNYVAFKTFEFNMIDMLQVVYNANGTADTLKSTIADLINLATEAQKYFGKEGNDLFTVQLPTERFNPTSTTEFNSEELATTNSVTSSVGATANLALSIKTNPATYFIISGLSSYDKSNLTFEISYTNGLNGKIISENLNGADITYVGGRYYWVFDDIAFYDLNKPVTAKVYNAGSIDPVLTIDYSVETYISSHYNDANQGSLLIAMAKFSKSARTHFIK